MIEYLFKMLQEKPSIVYIEDPLASSEKASWRKLIVFLNQLRPKSAKPKQLKT
jgi:enolase